MADLIATAVTTHCLPAFKIATEKDGWAGSKVDISHVRDEYARFKVWVSSVGAQHHGQQSLDYRLRDASHLKDQVLKLLHSLAELLQDAHAILDGDKVPWDKDVSSADEVVDDEEDDDDDAWSQEDFAVTELEQILRSINNVICCLSRLSVSIRNPAHHDYFREYEAIDTTYFELYDIQHVREKFKGASDDISERLGRAITRRRRYFKYREICKARLDDAQARESNKEETVAPSSPNTLNTNTSGVLGLEDNTSWSQTSYTDSIDEPNDVATVRIPPIPREGEDGSLFECPFCYMTIVAGSRLAWKRHVVRDLRPYVCLHKNCVTPDHYFSHRRDWMQHTLQFHWKSWHCPVQGCSSTKSDGSYFGSAAECQNHLETCHPGAFSATLVHSVVQLSESLIDLSNGVACPICGELLMTVQQYQKHVGHEQYQLSLFALPKLSDNDNEDENDDESSDSAESTGLEEVHIQEEENATGSANTGIPTTITPEISISVHNEPELIYIWFCCRCYAIAGDSDVRCPTCDEIRCSNCKVEEIYRV